jgi:hypothetical protein
MGQLVAGVELGLRDVGLALRPRGRAAEVLPSTVEPHALRALHELHRQGGGQAWDDPAARVGCSFVVAGGQRRVLAGGRVVVRR